MINDSMEKIVKKIWNETFYNQIFTASHFNLTYITLFSILF